MHILFLTNVLVLLCDYYLYQALRTILRKKHPRILFYFGILHWSALLVFILLIWVNHFITFEGSPFLLRRILKRYLFLMYAWKLIFVFLLGLEDLKRAALWCWGKRKTTPRTDMPLPSPQTQMTRSEFLAKSAIVLSAVPVSTLGFGVLRGASDYQLHTIRLHLPKLPKAFHGMRIGQFTDVHAGSFFSKASVSGGVELLLKQKADMVFFTGDFVNYETKELKPYFDIFQKVKAPLGVFSVMGNHDYGGYGRWKTTQAYEKNLLDMYQIHQALGYDLLRNENRILRLDGEELAILGVENWGIRKRHPRLGDVRKAYQGTEASPVKLLLSHDPSHWDAQVRSLCPEIDVTFSGHTHGMQCGLEWGDFQWSPIQYIYPQWAGLYQHKNQKIYVNRGFGVADIFPGRIGMPPEITVFELLKY